MKFAMTAALFATLTAGAANAGECKSPNAPDMSMDGAAHSVDSFNALTRSLDAYDEGADAYRSCLDAILGNPQKHSQEEWRAALTHFNSVSTEQTAIHSQYDEVASSFRNSQASRATTAARQESEASIAKSEKELARLMAKAGD